MHDQVMEQLNHIFREVFNDNSITAKREMTSADVDRWDSLSHIDMIVMVEEHFGIKIPTWQVSRLNNVGELVDVIVSRKNA
jgi:acyl carrier protein